MDEVLKGGTGAVFVFLYLLPGFLGALVYDFLVEGRKRDNFERIVAALVLTLLSSVALKVGFGISLLPVAVDQSAAPIQIINAFVGKNLFYGSLLSVAIATVFAVLNNFRVIYGVLRCFRITNKNSSVDVWADIFNHYRAYWIRIRFTDGRSLVGWPRFYSQFGDPREIFLVDAVWWEPDANGATISSEVAGPGLYVADFSNVTSIEVLN